MRGSELKEAMLVLELHRAEFRFRHAKDGDEKERRKKELKQSEANLHNYMAKIKMKQNEGR